MPKSKATKKTTAIARGSFTGVPWKIALRNFRQVWRADNPGVRLPGGRKSKKMLIWEQCDIIRSESRLPLTLGQLVSRVKEKHDCSDDTIRKHVKTWMDGLPINEIPQYYLNKKQMQDFFRNMLSFQQAFQASATQIDSWIKTLPPGAKLKDIKASPRERLKKRPARSPEQK